MPKHTIRSSNNKQTKINQIKSNQPVKSIASRKLVECNCDKCDGKKVDPRTRKKHNDLEEQLKNHSSKSSRPAKKNKFEEIQIETPIFSNRNNRNIIVIDSSTSSSSSSSDDDKGKNRGPEKPISRKRYDRFHHTDILEMNQDEESDQSSSLSSEEELVHQQSGDELTEEDQFDLNDGEIPFDRFSAPDLNGIGSNPDPDYFNSSNTSASFGDLWILLWIFKFQERFRLPDVAVDALIKFFRLVLLDADKRRFNKFPTSEYNARKLLEIGGQTKMFAVCPDCNKLHNTENNRQDGFKCDHVEFPTHPMQNRREACGTEILKKVLTVKGYIWRPKLQFPLPSLKNQLITLFQRPGFEQQLRKWTNRDVGNELMSDIYEGIIWRTFPSTIEDPNSRFFTPETADSHLGIIINLDWFQPFESSVYSTGVMYGAICNLPRDRRFKKENMLTLGLLPGPQEVKKHRINHFLAPIIDELLELWNGYDLPISTKFPNGKRIRLAVICCSNDIPAARKLCGHISALAACHRCHKRASGDDGQRANFGGFDDMSSWFTMRDPDNHRQNAISWLHCRTEDERKRHVSSTLARWSEMLRLPYHDPIRHLIVDPMHCLFLGIAHWIVKRLWVEGGKITKSQLEEMEEKVNHIKLPADLGRIPNKIATGEGFSGFTADQWKTFILVYATPLMWNILADYDREILCNFVRACFLLTSRIIGNNALNEAHSRLLRIALLIEEKYGPEFITPNIHLSLHITDCCRDYGPLHSFWCYSFERMNGILGKQLSGLFSNNENLYRF
jgi:Transposase family tnp2